MKVDFEKSNLMAQNVIRILALTKLAFSQKVMNKLFEK